MTPKHDLETAIRASYALIRQYAEKMQLSDDPQEQANCRRTIDEQQGLIRDYLAQYYHVCTSTAQQPAADIREIAATLDAYLPSSVTPHRAAAPGTVTSHITISNSSTGDVAGRDINKTATPGLLNTIGTLIQRIRGR